jgi:hypothetical protein
LAITSAIARGDDAVALDADQLRLVVGPLEQLLDRRIAHHRSHVTVEGARRSAALHVSEDRDPRILAQSLLQRLLDVGHGYRVAVNIGGAFGDQHDVGSTADRAPAAEHVAHRVLPVGTWRVLGDQHEVGTGGQTAHQRQIAATPPHHLDHERALVARRGALDRVDGLDDPVQRGVGADRHVGARHVVVDRADDADQPESAVLVGAVGVEQAGGHELVEQLRPFFAEHVGAGEAAVAADHHQSVDVAFDEVQRRPATPFTGAEVLAARGAEHRATDVEDAAHVGRGHRRDAVAAVDQTLEPLVDGEHIKPRRQTSADDGAHGGVHPRRITAAGQDRELARNS